MTNSKTTKRALLSSTLALLMCVAMLIGTTFAWFTDTASTGINRIQSGNLDMEVYHQVGEDEWELIDGATDLFSNVNGEAILWEPGVTATETFKIVNKGNLAFKYAFYLNYANATKTADGKTLADVLTCGLTDYVPTTPITSLEDIVTYNYLLPGDEIKLQVYIKWEPTDHDNDYNVEGGLSIDLGVNVFATQYTYEKDSIDNQYDADAQLPSVWDGTVGNVPELVDGERHITNAAEFAAVMAATTSGNSSSLYVGETLVLDCDIDFGGKTISGIGGYNDNVAFTFDGNGHTISNFVINGKDDAHKEPQPDGSVKYRYAGLFQQFNGTVKDLTVKNAIVIGDQMVGIIASNVDNGGKIIGCKVYDSTVVGARKVGAVAGYIAGAGCEISGCYAENVNVYATSTDVKQSGEIVGYLGTASGDATFNGNTATNVNVYRNVAPQFVNNADELKAAVAANTENVVVFIGKDFAVSSDWTPIDFGFYSQTNQNIKNLIINGNKHTVTGLTKSFIKRVAGGCELTINDLTIKGADINGGDYSNGMGNGIMVAFVENGSVDFNNCSVIDSRIEDSATGTSAFVGYAASSAIANQTINFVGCSVKNNTVKNSSGNAAGFIGYVQQEVVNIKSCNVSGNDIVGGSGAKDGAYVGTVNQGAVINIDANTTVDTEDTIGRILGTGKVN